MRCPRTLSGQGIKKPDPVVVGYPQLLPVPSFPHPRPYHEPVCDSVKL